MCQCELGFFSDLHVVGNFFREEEVGIVVTTFEEVGGDFVTFGNERIAARTSPGRNGVGISILMGVAITEGPLLILKSSE
uniref:Uncharacterized protein n=1 Tax=Caenorhabditis japonica TaxID=281687 RepID=A0A8R1IEV1_CAEJA